MTGKQSILFVLLLFVTAPQVSAQSGLDTLLLKDIFHEPVLPGIRPSFSGFSPDLNEIYFSWNDSSYYETGLYKTDFKGSEPVEIDEDETVTNYSVSPDGSLIVYTKKGDLYISGPGLKDPRAIVSTPSGEYGPRWSPDSKKIAFVREGNIWITDVEKTEIRQITQKDKEDPEYSVITWAGNNRLIASQSDHSDSRMIYFPEYVDTFVKPGASSRGIPVTTFTAVGLDSLDIDTLRHGRYRSSVSAGPSGSYVAIDQADGALKHREIVVFDFELKSETIVFEDSTKGWLSGRNMAFAPESRRIMFQSEKDNWNHIYTVNPDGSNLQQHTSGDYDIPWAEWLTDSEIIYASTEEDYGERQL